MGPWSRVLSWKSSSAAVAPAAEPAATLQHSSGLTAGKSAPPASTHAPACPTSPQSRAAGDVSAPAAADTAPPDQPRRRHHRADLRTPDQAVAALQPHTDRAAAAVNCAEAAKIELSLDLEVEWLTAIAFLLQVSFSDTKQITGA